MTNSTVVAKPAPVVSEWAKPFWEATKQGRLIIQQCNDCNKPIFYPRSGCPHCASADVGWIEASGRGSVYSFTVVESNAPSAFQQDIPFVVAVILLEEGVRMLSNVVQCDPHSLRCDMPVQVVFEAGDGDFVLPKFKPAA